jgi:hypothetical protein
MTDREIKIRLINDCVSALTEKLAVQREAMEAAQAEANSHKGAMASV